MTESNQQGNHRATTDTILSARDMIASPGNLSSNSVLMKRQAREWSQAELAKRAGISRAAVSAIEGERLTPSVAIALSLAKVLGCSVEELFARGPFAGSAESVWAWQPWQEPCRYWEAEVSGRRLLYPIEASILNPLPQDGIWNGGVCQETQPAAPEMTLTVATCDPAVGLLAHEYARESGFRMLVFPRGGSAALDLLKQRYIHVAALHRSTDENPDRNAASVRTVLGESARLLRVASWESGIVLPSSKRARSVRSFSRQVRQWATREPGSAARECLDELLGNKLPPGRVVNGHHAVAEAVLAGWADAGVCVKLPAVEAHLNFLPLQTESLDFCFRAGLENDPRIQALIRVLRSRRYRETITHLPGYDARHTGELSSL